MLRKFADHEVKTHVVNSCKYQVKQGNKILWQGPGRQLMQQAAESIRYRLGHKYKTINGKRQRVK